MKIKLVLSMQDVREFTVESEEDLIETMAEYGFKHNGRSISEKSEGRPLLLRKELQDQPEFEGLNGPCYDCSDRVSFRDTPDTFIHRYETWEVYNTLSI